MCRYAFKTYKIHFACFDCRKSFKKAPIEDLAIQNGDWEDYKEVFWNISSGKNKKLLKENPEKVEYLTEKYKNRKEKCPECGGLMADLGLDFKAPKKDKVKEWEIIRGLYRSGKTFYSCGCDGIGYVPKDKKAYKDYLIKNRTYYQDRLENRDATLHKEKLSDYINRFSHLIELIENELKLLNVS
ncbi:hypothetical protein [Xanthovirga aplysinae]|uniref:hypothetical protein n=1 Tax=Xanthovirga aplysinae TaxID=2529853 RepID=UPI0012BBC5F2|nr:hypothetical protein [Xanthovirga aplysinae]MTI29256.1 hypothetical protein [Xanthovirga aplysinae]